MRPYQKIRRLIVVFIAVLLLSACGTNRTKDKIEVFDEHEKKLGEFTDQKTLDEFSELVAKGTDQENEKKDDFPFISLPQDAQVERHFLLTLGREGRETERVNCYIYKNYPYITIKDVPVVGSMTWKLSDAEVLKLKALGEK